jgi:hypothetical protein
VTIKELENNTKDYGYICRVKECFNDTFKALADGNICCSACGTLYTFDKMVANGWLKIVKKKTGKKVKKVNND